MTPPQFPSVPPSPWLSLPSWHQSTTTTICMVSPLLLLLVQLSPRPRQPVPPGLTNQGKGGSKLSGCPPQIHCHPLLLLQPGLSPHCASDGSSDKLAFYLNWVWAHINHYGEGYTNNQEMITAITENLEGEAAEWVTQLYVEGVPELENIYEFLQGLRKRFEDMAQTGVGSCQF